MRIIPAIDLMDGECVRLSGGVFSSPTRYSNTPSVIAERFVAEGAKYLHVVDLDGARKGTIVNWKPIVDILSLDGLRVDVGGGVRTSGDISRLLDAGADKVVVGSVALRSFEIVEGWIREFGSSAFCVALDFRDGWPAVNGWTETIEVDTGTFLRRIHGAGITEVLSTDISRDGMLAGPNLDLYDELIRTHPGIQWIASGGIRSVDDVCSLARTGVHGAIVGKALYEGNVSLRSLLEAPC